MTQLALNVYCATRWPLSSAYSNK